MISNNLTAVEISTLNENKINWGSCYTSNLLDNTKYCSCTLTKQEDCFGVFVSKTECSTINLSPIVKDDRGNWYATSMSESVFTNVTPGSYIQNLIYAGIYIPSSLPIFTGATNHVSNDSTKYAILIYPKLVSYSFSNKLPLNTQTSLYSGSYNKIFGNRIESKLNEVEEDDQPDQPTNKAWLDFYIPSFAELVWLKKQIKFYSYLKNKINNLMANTNSVLTSSTVFLESPVLYPATKQFNKLYMRAVKMSLSDTAYTLVNPKLISNLTHWRAIPLN
jgi:hypothetical protein